MTRFIPLFLSVLTIMFVCIFTNSVHAQSYIDKLQPITKTQANEFYATCLEQNYPANTTESKELFCSCSSANFFERLSQGDINDLQFEETRQAAKAKEKLLQYVYLPCIKTTATDIISEECYSSTYLDDYPHISKNQFCACQMQRTKVVFRNGLGAMINEAQENVDATLADPISSFLKGDYYQSQVEIITPICMSNATITVEKLTPLVAAPAPLVVKPTDHNHSHGNGGNETGANNGNAVNPNPIQVASVDTEPKETKPPVKQVKTKKVCTARVPYGEAYKKENIRLQIVEEEG